LFEKKIGEKWIGEKQFSEIEPSIIEPTMKTLLEVTYECLVDSGMSPVELKGSRTGVFIGLNKWETIEEPKMMSWLSGKPMLAERLAHFFEFKGPVITIEKELSTSLVAMDKAVNAIKLGLCDFAIVGGVKVGQTVGVVLLQKRSTMPRRFYAKVLHSKVIEESEVVYPTIQSQIQSRILKEIYAENGIDTSAVSYLESTGMEKEELKTITDIFVKPIVKRNVPLFVGVSEKCVEETGILALVKMLISIQRGIIPANLKYKEPVELLGETTPFKFVNKNTKFFGGLMALNSMVNLKCGRFLNTHILLQPNQEIVMSQVGAESFWNREDLIELSRQPRLFQFSARTKQELEEIMEHMYRNPQDLAMHFLLHPHTFTTPVSHPFRGFSVLNSEIPIVKKIVEIEEMKKRPVWYILSGLSGSIRGEWKQMAQELMKVDIFRQSVIRSTEHLKPFGLNLIELIYGQYQLNTWNTLVGITAVQMALIDSLKVAGVKYDGLIGHSLGELLCAYVEKALTAEETILTSYYLGKYIHEAKFPLYTMAIVKGISWEELKRICPVGIVPVVFNGVENIVISGPKYELIQFIEQLKYEGVYVKELTEEETTFSHLPFHTELMQVVAKKLKTVLEQEVIRTPRRLRSPKWISTSMPVKHWESEYAKYFSVDYLVNSLVSPVNFHESFKYVPTDAICIEISPKSIFKTILKESSWTKPIYSKEFPEMTWIPLMKQKNFRKETPIVLGGYLDHFWYVFGKLYLKGINVDSVKLFVPVKHEHTIYPVPVNTKFLSNLIPSSVRLFEKQQPKFWEQEYTRKFVEQNIRRSQSEMEPKWLEEMEMTRKFIEEPRFLEKEFTRKFEKMVEEPRFLEKELTRKYEKMVEEPRFLEMEMTRKFIEEPRFLEKEFTRKYEKMVEEPRFLEKELTRKYIEEPRFLEKELTRKYEKMVEETKLMYPFERKEFLELKQTTPILFKYPVDLSVETEMINHKIEGRVVYPTSGYLWMVWKSLAKMQGLTKVEQLPIKFEEVEFHRPTIMIVRGTPVKKIFTFEVKIVPTTGLFEIIEDGLMIVSGRVSIPKCSINQTIVPLMTPVGFELLRREEIYNELKIKGIEYEEEFKPLIKADLKCKYAEMMWTGRWVPFLEGLIQMKTFAKRSVEGILIPRRIRSMIIDPSLHLELIEKKYMNKLISKQSLVVPVVYDRITKKTVACGVEIVEIKCQIVPTIEKIEREILKVLPLRQSEEIEGELVEQFKREYVEFYMNECKRYAVHILKKVELKSIERELIRQSIVSTPLPKTIKHLLEKITYERRFFKHQPLIASLLEGGDFLRFLKTIVQEIELVKEESVLRRIKSLFNENMFFYKALEKDSILSLINMKSYFFDFFKTILETKFVEEPKFFDLESRIRLPVEEKRIFEFRLPEETRIKFIRSPSKLFSST
jgi:malonyl CoA-acyl carrier protein transacylase